jgi:hypothetical protein
MGEITKFLPNDTKKKMHKEKVLENSSMIFDLVFETIDYNFSLLEKINKMNYSTYETNMIIDSGLLSIPILVNIAKQRIDGNKL